MSLDNKTFDTESLMVMSPCWKNKENISGILVAVYLNKKSFNSVYLIFILTCNHTEMGTQYIFLELFSHNFQ